MASRALLVRLGRPRSLVSTGARFYAISAASATGPKPKTTTSTYAAKPPTPTPPRSSNPLSTTATAYATRPGASPPATPEGIQPEPPAPPLTAGFASEDGAAANGNGDGSGVENHGRDWSKSYHGLSAEPFPKESSEVLMAPVEPNDIECKPDGLIYLPEIKYRRILNRAFGPGGWGLAPRSETNVTAHVVSREYALVCLGRLVAIARGEQEYFDPEGIPTATEACKSNALMRCCKDLGIASELWDPRFIREFKQKYCAEVFAENVTTKKKKKLWRRRDAPKFEYPWKE